MTIKRVVHDKIQQLAEALLDSALDTAKTMTAKERVEIFKPVSLWYLGTQKAKKGDSDEPDDSGTFDDMRARLNPTNGAKMQ